MTRGIDVVAFFTARVAGRPSGNDHVHLQGDQLSDENRKALILSTWTSPRSRSRRRRTTIRADRSSVLAEIRDQSPDLLLEPVDPEPTRVPAPLIRPVAERELLDIDSLSANPRAYRATHVAADVRTRMG